MAPLTYLTPGKTSDTIMRKTALLTTLCLIISAASLHAQVWLEIGPKASFGLSGYYNSVLANEADHDYSLNLAYNYGAAIGVNIGDYHGINFEGLFGTYFQNLTYRSADGPQRNSLEWDVIDLYALYRYYPSSGYYFELGPKYSSVREISQTLGIDPIDIKNQYEDSYISGVLGLGAFLSGSEVLVIKAGLRFEYGLTDLVSADGMAANFPAFYSDLPDMGSTIPFRASFGLEISFGIGGFAKAVCGNRGFVLGGRYR